MKKFTVALVAVLLVGSVTGLTIAQTGESAADKAWNVSVENATVESMVLEDVEVRELQLPVAVGDDLEGVEQALMDALEEQAEGLQAEDVQVTGVENVTTQTNGSMTTVNASVEEVRVENASVDSLSVAGELPAMQPQMITSVIEQALATAQVDVGSVSVEGVTVESMTMEPVEETAPTTDDAVENETVANETIGNETAVNETTPA